MLPEKNNKTKRNTLTTKAKQDKGVILFCSTEKT